MAQGMAAGLPALAERLRRLLPGTWLGLLACIAALATPAPFAVLPKGGAGPVVAYIFVREAWLSVAVALLLWVLERQRARLSAEAGRGSVLSTEMVLLLATLLCTFVGYFAVQQLLPAARAGEGPFTFGQLHALSFGLFGLKMLLVAVLAWRATAR